MKVTVPGAFFLAPVLSLSFSNAGAVPAAAGVVSSPGAHPSAGPFPASRPDFESLSGFITSYAIAVDDKNATKLASLFASNAVATYTTPDQTVTGNTAIAKHDLDSFAGLNTFHDIVPMSIQPTTSNNTFLAITYFTATIFGKDCYLGQIVNAQGRYTDTIENINGEWAISKRAQTYANPADPYIGNLAIVLGPACNSTKSG